MPRTNSFFLIVEYGCEKKVLWIIIVNIIIYAHYLMYILSLFPIPLLVLLWCPVSIRISLWIYVSILCSSLHTTICIYHPHCCCRYLTNRLWPLLSHLPHCNIRSGALAPALLAHILDVHKTIPKKISIYTFNGSLWMSLLIWWEKFIYDERS